MKKEKRMVQKGKKRGALLFLHVLQNIAIVTAVVLATKVYIDSYIMIETAKGTESYHLRDEENGVAFEDSKLFNQLLGKSVTDIICFGAIRGQMETDAVFDAKKEVDVTAFANRYNGVEAEYITAKYYLDDLIKWSKNGFDYEDVHMTGQEADRFLSRTSTITVVNFDKSVYPGGTVTYLNSDLNKCTKVKEVSGNLFDSGDYIRDDVNASVLTNRYHSVDGKNIENYVSTWEEYYTLCDNIRKAADDLAINYNEYYRYEQYYHQKNSNVRYYISKKIGAETIVFSNDKKNTVTEFSQLRNDAKQQGKKYIFYDPINMKYETNTLIEEATLRYVLNGYEYSYPENTQILICVDTDYPMRDCFVDAKEKFHNIAPYYLQYIIAAVFLGVLYLFLLLLITWKEGEAIQKENGEILFVQQTEDRIPTEIMCILLAVFCMGILKALNLLQWQIDIMREKVLGILLVGLMTLVISLAFSFFYYSFVRRIKAGTLWKNSVIRRCGILVKKGWIYAYHHGTALVRVFVPFGLFVIVHILLIYLAFDVHAAFLLALIVVDGIVGYFLYHSAQGRQSILEGINRIRKGDTKYKVDEKGFYGDELILAQAVNNIGESVQKAVETSMKDERLKADLITNVSHDIKTPLTSIINYVDLIKRENIENQKVKEYVAILDSKSQRLKQLTDDLVEASKISSGNIVLQLEKINLIELLNQTIGEFSEKFSQKSLIPVFEAPKEVLCIQADSRRIWRIMENLFNNIFKYAMQGTRIYIEIQKIQEENGGNQVALSIKNISEKPLNIKPEELVERFIRGDESRTTEGSGLGLSIAKNLTEAQQGKLDILMDGDLFKVVLIFPLLEA